jgi:hypothetical protein
MLAYVFPAVVIVLRASERVLAARLAAYKRPPAHHFAPGRPGTFPACSNCFNILCDLRFVFGYVFPAVVVVWSAIERVLAQAFGLRERPPAYHHAPSRLATVPACSNRLYIFPDLRFMLVYVFPAVVVVLSACD